MNMTDWIKGRIKYYRKCAGTKNDAGERVGNQFQDSGNILMAEKIIKEYEKELHKVEEVTE